MEFGLNRLSPKLFAARQTCCF